MMATPDIKFDVESPIPNLASEVEHHSAVGPPTMDGPTTLANGHRIDPLPREHAVPGDDRRTGHGIDGVRPPIDEYVVGAVELPIRDDPGAEDSRRMSQIDQREVHVSDRVARFFAERNPATPCLVLDLAVIEQRYRRIRSAMPSATPYFAVKACPEPAVIRLLAGLGGCFDVASRGEIDLCLRHGAAPESLSFGNTVKKEADIAYAHALGVRLFVFDNAREVVKLARAAPGSRVFCRLLAGSEGARWPLSDKFGCRPESSIDLLRIAADLGLEPYGLSFHVGSQQTDPSRWRASIRIAAEIFLELELAGIELTMLNIGGGYPAPYVEDIPPIGRYGEVIGEAVREFFGPGEHPRIISEPGRYLSAEAGVLRTEVVSIRDAGENGERWIYLDAGRFGGLAETEGEAIRYRLAASASGPMGPAVLAGPTCDSVDVMYRRSMPDLPLGLDAGDTVDFLAAGAYTASYASCGFNGLPPLTTYCIGAGE
jgi:ornithine decarboxylase